MTTPPGAPGSLRQLGGTEIKVTPVSVGTISWSAGAFNIAGWAYRSHRSQDGVNEIVELALRSGINWFDTAEMYGRVDGMLATALREARHKLKDGFGDVVIATKWKPFCRTAKSIERGINRQLRELNLPILHQIHWPMGSFSGLDKQLREFARLHNDKVIAGVGVSNFSADQMRLAYDVLGECGVSLASNQIRASLLHREHETNGVLETAELLGVSLLGYYPLESGLLTGRFHRDSESISDIPRLRRIANKISHKNLDDNKPLTDLINLLGEIGAEHKRSEAQVAVAWLINRYGNTMFAIPGASSPWHARESAEAMRLQLTDEEVHRLNKASDPFTPASQAATNSTPSH